MSGGVGDSMHAPDSAVIKSLVAKPWAYDGTPGTYHDWQRVVRLYVRAHPKEIKDPWDTALILISYLTQGRVAAFGNAFFKEIDAGGKATFTYTDETI
jgi:hypothetical protein